MGSWDDELAHPVRSEAARLRRLTVDDDTSSTAFDLVGPVRDLVETRRAAGAIVELEAPTNAIVSADESDVLAIVDNLLSNAQRHGRPPITARITQSGRTIRISVADGGSGLSVAEAERVFQRGMSTHPDGSGFGLSRVRTLAERNNGSVAVEQLAGGRTTFVLVLESAEVAAR